MRVFGPDLEVLAKKAEEIAARIGRGRRDHRRAARADRADSASRGRGRCRGGPALWAQARGTSAASLRRLLASEEVSDIFAGGKAYDVHVWSIPSARDSVTDVENLPIDTPSGAQVRLDRVADVRISADRRTRSSTRSSRAGSTRSPTWSGRDLASTVDDVKAQLDEVDFPPGYHAEVLGEATELNAAQNGLLLFGLDRGGRHLPPASRRPSGQPASGRARDVPAPADGARRRRARGEAQRPASSSLGSLVGFLTVFGIAASQRDPDDQPLPASRARRGRALRPGARPARRPGAARADPHDRLATGLALVPLVVAGTVPGHEIEHPDGDRRSSAASSPRRCSTCSSCRRFTCVREAAEGAAVRTGRDGCPPDVNEEVDLTRRDRRRPCRGGDRLRRMRSR